MFFSRFMFGDLKYDPLLINRTQSGETYLTECNARNSFSLTKSLVHKGFGLKIGLFGHYIESQPARLLQ